jgi:enolase
MRISKISAPSLRFTSNPTVEAQWSWKMARSHRRLSLGASTGEKEAVELRDGDRNAMAGKVC